MSNELSALHVDIGLKTASIGQSSMLPIPAGHVDTVKPTSAAMPVTTQSQHARSSPIGVRMFADATGTRTKKHAVYSIVNRRD